ncbi:ABC transporter ATP-binding protein [Trabulsiella odontotermitis]|uniref:Glycine/betaine ABC transporter n=1 Tax=Trabulsiella odontotermitis TaxID=379893 RepID=A0A0L0GXN4_9ENTR|nr:ABC transporter ATP-binding protein [Trabulsiella odontotermitis]KNC93461.1 glycine/betaine ABC transporter [Trabulsiella odontotermitis]
MITLENISKIYPGSPRKALDDLSMTFEEGTTTALIGPSGCGKTTTMRLINRLEQPTSGRIWVNGRDIATEDPVMLRRHIGYVIQNVGLFPHMTVADNIATVPRLLGWNASRIQARVEELLELVGLDAGQHSHRFPAALSGGQRQRVGVARALAADPPVMLMDEPFGAIDPLVRGRLQTEFKQILQRVKKTVIIVTHDLDEAIKMGDRIAIMREGKLCQYAPPAEVLSSPADAFVASFVGSDATLKLLAITPVKQAMEPALTTHHPHQLEASATLKDALALMLSRRTDSLTVIENSAPVGVLTREQLFAHVQSDTAHVINERNV